MFNMIGHVFILLTVSVCCSSMLLNKFPILLSHDAATGDIVKQRDHVVDDWAQTQSVGLVGQLECGSRGFDYRPYLKNGTLYAHHGPVIIHKPMEESLAEVKLWAKAHRSELIIFYITDCGGESECIEDSKKLLNKHNVNTVENCVDLDSLTVETVLAKDNLLAVIGCVSEQYDPSINCYSKDFVCYESWPDDSKAKAWQPFEAYFQSVTQTAPVQNGMLWMTQAHWQSTATSVVLGTLHNSSLIKDESRSGMNAWVLRALQSGSVPAVNLLEVDHVCDSGAEITAELKKRSRF